MRENTKDAIRQEIENALEERKSPFMLSARQKKIAAIVKDCNLNIVSRYFGLSDVIDVSIDLSNVFFKTNIYRYKYLDLKTGTVAFLLQHFLKTKKRTDLTVSEFMETYGYDKYYKYGIENCLRTLADEKNPIVRCDLCADLDNIFIKDF